MSILQTFRLVVAPEYAAMTDNEIMVFINEAKIEITEKVWGRRYERGLCLIAAHLISLSKVVSSGGAGGGVSGPIKRIKVGNIEREYATSSNENANEGGYDVTRYGKEFLRLRRQVLITPLFV